ncbi:MAG: GNAT family N-acetyltransferase [Pseudomonadota bacterium]
MLAGAMPVYPAHPEHVIQLRDGAVLSIRPLTGDDAPGLTDLFDHMTPEDVRRRFFVAMRELPPALLVRLSHPDDAREIALAALHPDAHGTLCGVARLSADAEDRRRAEFAVAVRSDWKQRGLGRALMEEIIRCADERRIEDLYGTILADNTPMIRLVRQLGFKITADSGDARLVVAHHPHDAALDHSALTPAARASSARRTSSTARKRLKSSVEPPAMSQPSPTSVFWVAGVWSASTALA